MSGPEFLLPDWTNFLGGPVRYPEDPEDDDQVDTPPPLEPVPDSPTVTRLRESLAKANWRSRWGV
ncbi:hypothetical protein [Streptomyces sp. MJM8645]|uniref:hypothetical protein n=1 Tax=Streptomyces sp. MJM8645 TaxID=1120523 RepID=UPI0007AFBE3F|nr:hypothetical protein [Streptomyces sp. MJM8645]